MSCKNGFCAVVLWVLWLMYFVTYFVFSFLGGFLSLIILNISKYLK